MTEPTPLGALLDRVERLLLRHDELKRTNALLQQELHSLQSERDMLKSRLQAARSRVDALLDRLPPAPSNPESHQAQP